MKAATINRIDPFVNGNGKAHRPTAAPPAPPAPPPPAPPAPETPKATERNTSGQFRPGNKGGPGNPFAKRVAGLRKALLDSVGEQDVAKLGRKLLDQAMTGDVAAAKVLLSYLVGKPDNTVDPDRIELEGWKLVLSWPTVSEALAGALVVQPSAAAELATAHAPGTADEVIRRGANPTALEGVARVIMRREKTGK